MAEMIFQQRSKQQESAHPGVSERRSGRVLEDNRAVSPATTQLKPNKTGLPDNLKSGIEHLSGMDVDHVRVHYNSSQPAQLNALAYAQGSNIHIAPGQEKHLPHEAWHVVQQAQGRVRPTMQMRGGVPVNDNKGLEREADVMGGRASGTSEEVAQRRDRGVLSQDLLGTTAVAQLLSVNYYPSGSPTKVGSANVQESNGAIASSVAPSDYDTGSVTNNAVRAVSQEATKVFAKRFIAGHMLNNHLGGPGTDQKNITAITSGQNSAHHAQLEKGAKALVKGGKTISYYTIITKRADFYNSTGTSKLADNLASELKGGYTDTSNGTSFGPVIIPLGPPSAVKKNEVATGMVASGGTTVTVSKSEEYASETAEAIMDVSYSSTLNGYVKSYYGKDEQDVKEGLVKIILLKSPDPMKLSSYFLKWSKDIENHALNGSTLPDFL